MKIIIKHVRRLWDDTSGASAIEYGLIAALIAVLIIVPLTLVGKKTNSTLICTNNAIINITNDREFSDARVAACIRWRSRL